MEIFYDRVDLAACWQMQIRNPIRRISRGPTEEWLVTDKPVVLGAPVQWTYYRQGAEVGIPLIPYLLRPDPDLAMAHMLAIGLQCAIELTRPIKRLHLVTGVPLEQIEPYPDFPELTLRYWVGFAVLL